MRAIVRYIVTGVWFLVAIVVGTVFRQNIEEFASANGWDAALANWWSGVSGAGYSMVLLLGFAALTGAVAVLWIDATLRGVLDQHRRDATRYIKIRFDPKTKDYNCAEIKGIAGYHLMVDPSTRETSLLDPKLSKHQSVLTLIYDYPVKQPDFNVTATHPILFQVFNNSEKFSFVDIDWRGAKEPVVIEVFVFSPRRHGELHTWDEHWQEPLVIDPKAADHSSQSPLGTGAEKQL